MKGSEVFPSKYLKAEDLDEDVEVTIKKVVLEELEQKDGTKQQKPVCYFEEGPKGLIVNKTNWSLIAKQHGDESDNWIGKTVTLTTVDVDAFGDVVSAIRIKPPRKPVSGGAFPKKPPKQEHSWRGETVMAVLKAKLAKTPQDAVMLLNNSGLDPDVSPEDAVAALTEKQD
jgi:hypothetical protein